MSDLCIPGFGHVFCYDEVESTNSAAMHLAAEGLDESLLVVAEMQSGGVGRQARNWHSPRGGLWFTAALLLEQLPPALSLYTGHILMQGLVDIIPDLQDRLAVKWPNDIYLDNRKMAGVLISWHRTFNLVLLGVGVNTNLPQIPLELAHKATSLQLALQHQVDNRQLLATFWQKFFAGLPGFMDDGLDPLLATLNEHDFLRDKSVTVVQGDKRITGLGRGLDNNGNLLLLTVDGLTPVLAGTVEFNEDNHMEEK